MELGVTIWVRVAESGKKAQKRIQTERKTKGSVAFHNNDTSGHLQPKEPTSVKMLPHCKHSAME